MNQKIKINLFQKVIVILLMLISISCSFLCKENGIDVNILEKQHVIVNTQPDSIFSGIWDWIENDDNKTFTIQINSYGDSLYIICCGIMQKGNRIDCPSDGYSAVVVNIGQSIIDAYVNFSYSGKERSVIMYVQTDTLFWKITDPRDSQNIYCPNEAILIKH